MFQAGQGLIDRMHTTDLSTSLVRQRIFNDAGVDRMRRSAALAVCLSLL